MSLQRKALETISIIKETTTHLLIRNKRGKRVVCCGVCIQLRVPAAAGDTDTRSVPPAPTAIYCAHAHSRIHLHCSRPDCSSSTAAAARGLRLIGSSSSCMSVHLLKQMSQFLSLLWSFCYDHLPCGSICSRILTDRARMNE